MRFLGPEKRYRLSVQSISLTRSQSYHSAVHFSQIIFCHSSRYERDLTDLQRLLRSCLALLPQRKELHIFGHFQAAEKGRDRLSLHFQKLKS